MYRTLLTKCFFGFVTLLFFCSQIGRVSLNEILSRDKRSFLIFPMSGQFKLVIGIGIPVQLGLKQSMVFGVNMQYQFAVATNVSKIKEYPPIISRSTKNRYKRTVQSDRTAAYYMFEEILERHGLNGRTCLLKSICENAFESFYHRANGLYGELAHIFLTPDYGDNAVDYDLDTAYYEAQKSGYPWGRTANERYDQQTALAPEFDDLSIREIQARIGQTVLLPCTVRKLGDKVVSWIRTKDLHILTSGSITFSADNRFESVSSPKTNFWGLRLRGVRPSDGGRYECQVNTDPKMSMAINLTVTGSMKEEGAFASYKWVNIAKIKGPAEAYIRVGSPAIFSCEISTSPSFRATPEAKSPLVPARKSPIFWLHDGKQISFDTSRGGISVETDYRDHNSVSRLRVAEVSPQDEGLYTCTQASAKPASVRLVTVEAEHSEAMQRDAPHSSFARVLPSLIILITCIIWTHTNLCTCNIINF